ncbi:transglycosylase domain-containing protein [Glaciihabitans sp. UYNi722]|uniref:transglycosylase domain-containing protein n=1 Tax=Glaciihabitans sp. UYNi722 TaxID=3156344 RepID=UPI003396F199
MPAQKVKFSRALGGLVGLVGFSVIAGVLVTAMVAPALAVTSVAAKSTIGVFENLPDYIALGGQAQRNDIYGLRGGQPVPIATVYNQNREDVSWDNVSPFLKDAAVAGEDRRYYTHGGVDLQSLMRAGVGFVTKTGSTGGSTIAMQLVKNIRVAQSQLIDDKVKRDKAYADAIKTSPDRKLEEMKLAIGLEKRYSKKEILLAYLNINGFGGVTYGVQAAAQRFFGGISAKDVTIAEAASLIATVQRPAGLNLGDPKNYPANKLRRDTIINDMLDLKMITQVQHDEAIATPIESYVKLQPATNGCLNAADAKFFCDYSVRKVLEQPALGKSREERLKNWANGGYKVYTSIDLDQQDVAQNQLSTVTPATETRFALGSSAVALEPGTGKIRVMAQNKDYNNTSAATSAQTSINFSTDFAYGRSNGFQTGSTYKIFTLVDWLQSGHGLQERVDGTPKQFAANSFKCNGSPTGNAYFPQNDSPGEGGSWSVLRATTSSVNVAFVEMAKKLDLCKIRDDATAMGVHRADGAELETLPSSTLGTNLIAPMTMAAAIATIGANGTYCKPTAIDKIVGPDGKDLPGEPTECTNAITPQIAATVAYALKTVFDSGTATAGNPRDGVQLVGKTGTTDGSYQNWLIGTTTKIALAVWVGNIIGNPARATSKNPGGEQSLRQITVGRTNGYSLKFMIFKATMKSLNANPAYKGGAFPGADSSLLAGRSASVPNVVGQSSAAARKLLESLQFNVADGPTESSALPAGTVSRSDPAAGASSSLGSTVTLYTSDGSLSTVPDVVTGHSNSFGGAKAMLNSAGWNSVSQACQVVTSPDDVGKVVASNPAPGAQARPTDEIKLAVGQLKPCS